MNFLFDAFKYKKYHKMLLLKLQKGGLKNGTS